MKNNKQIIWLSIMWDTVEHMSNKIWIVPHTTKRGYKNKFHYAGHKQFNKEIVK